VRRLPCRQLQLRVNCTGCKLVFIPVARLQVVEEGYEFFAKRQLVTIFSAPNYCGEFDNAGAMMSVDDTLMCSFQVCLLGNICTSRLVTLQVQKA